MEPMQARQNVVVAAAQLYKCTELDPPERKGEIHVIGPTVLAELNERNHTSRHTISWWCHDQYTWTIQTTSKCRVSLTTGMHAAKH